MKNYIIVFVVVFIGYFLADSIYTQVTKDKTPGKAKRIECQTKTTTFERGFGDEDIKKAQTKLEQGEVEFSSTIEKAIYVKSELFEYVKLEETDKIFALALEKEIKKETESKGQLLKISYNIYENDVGDPGKKTKASKLYAGYVVMQVKNDKNKVIYKVQIDFMDKKGADIAQSIECCVKSFATFNKEKR